MLALKTSTGPLLTHFISPDKATRTVYDDDVDEKGDSLPAVVGTAVPDWDKPRALRCWGKLDDLAGFVDDDAAYLSLTAMTREYIGSWYQ